MFENIIKFFKKIGNKQEDKESQAHSKNAAKERLHLVLMQDRANVSADFLELMKQEIIEVIKKYIDVDEKEIDVRLTNQENADGTNGAPALYANIPILNIKNDARKIGKKETEKIEKKEDKEVEKASDNKEKSEEDKDRDKEKENKRIEKEAIEIIEDSNAKIQDEKKQEEHGDEKIENKNIKEEHEKEIKEKEVKKVDTKE